MRRRRSVYRRLLTLSIVSNTVFRMRERLICDLRAARLAGSPRRAAAALLKHDEWSDALQQSSPWSFALEPAAA